MGIEQSTTIGSLRKGG